VPIDISHLTFGAVASTGLEMVEIKKNELGWTPLIHCLIISMFKACSTVHVLRAQINGHAVEVQSKLGDCKCNELRVETCSNELTELG